MLSVSRIQGRLAYGGVLIVPARIQGHDVEMLVDTGAAYTALRMELVTLFSLPVALQRTRTIAPAHGPQQVVPVHGLPEIRLGGVLRRDVEILALTFAPALHIGGLLGMNVLRQFRVTIESDTGTLVLRRLEGLAA